MNKDEFLAFFKDGWRGIILAFVIGVLSWQVTELSGSNYADALLIALVIGMVVRTFLGNKRTFLPGFVLAPYIFIPLGAIFYAATSLNFVNFSKIDLSYTLLMISIILVYFVVIIGMGSLFKVSKKTTYLTATGSAICGASAICMTSPAVESEPDDVSISLVSVFIAGIAALFILPFFIGLFKMDNHLIALFSGMILQFTGFVKAFAADTVGKNSEFYTLASGIKAARYLGLLVAIPLFSSLIRKKVSVPYYLWVYLGVGLFVSYIPYISDFVAANIAMLKTILTILWAIAMATIGLNANLKAVFTLNGVKSVVMAFVGLLAAIFTFIIGISIIS